jgi:hypothetical protein
MEYSNKFKEITGFNLDDIQSGKLLKDILHIDNMSSDEIGHLKDVMQQAIKEQEQIIK